MIKKGYKYTKLNKNGMRKITLLLILILISAWDWNGHRALADSAFYSFPSDLREKMNLTAMEEGSIAPDSVFRDNFYHHYPYSYERTVKWLREAKSSFENKDYNKASFAFGVASHYISDSFSAPHYIKKEDFRLHSEYEKQAAINFSFIKCVDAIKNYDLNTSIEEGGKEGRTWDLWIKTKNPEIPGKSIEKAMPIIYQVAQETFNYKCEEIKTEYERRYFYAEPWQIVLASVVIAIILFLIWSLVKEN